MATSKVTNFTVENIGLQLPTHWSLVDGLDSHLTDTLAAFNSSTIKAQFDGLGSKYLTVTGKAANASKADSCTTALKATQDGSGNVITSTYLTKTGTAAKATGDGNGLNIANNYVKIGDKVSAADSCTTALKATQDDAGQNIRSTYIKGVGVSADGRKLNVTGGAGNTDSYDLPRYDVATAAAMGLMSTADKVKLDGIEAQAQNFYPTAISPSDYDQSMNNVCKPGLYWIEFCREWLGSPSTSDGSALLIVFSHYSVEHYTEAVPAWSQILLPFRGMAIYFRAWTIRTEEPGTWNSIAATAVSSRTEV